MDALIIIDMQNDCFATERLDRESTTRRINVIAARFRDRGLPVFFIQHDGSAENYLVPGTPGFNVIDELVAFPSDRRVIKTANSAFYETSLDEELRDLGVSRLFICGLATDFCVNATIHSAIVKDYNLVILSDSHTTADRPTLKAKGVIDFHNWLWSDLTPTRGSIKVIPVKEALDLV